MFTPQSSVDKLLRVTLVVDCAAVGVFLLINLPLFASRDVAAIDGRIRAFFRSDRVIVGTKLVSLGVAELAIRNARADPAVLVRQTRVDFGPTWMVRGPIFSRGARARANGEQQSKRAKSV